MGKKTLGEWGESEGSIQKTNKAGYTATLVACGWVGAVIEEIT